MYRHRSGAGVSKPLVDALQRGGTSQRPKLAVEQRTALLGEYEDDIATLERVLGESFDDWRSSRRTRLPSLERTRQSLQP